MPPKDAKSKPSEWRVALFTAKISRIVDRISLCILLAQYHLWPRDDNQTKPDASSSALAVLTADDVSIHPQEYTKEFQRLCREFALHPTQPCPAVPIIKVQPIEQLNDVSTKWPSTLSELNTQLTALSAECRKVVLSHGEEADRSEVDRLLTGLRTWRIPPKEKETRVSITVPINSNLIAPGYGVIHHVQAPYYGASPLPLRMTPRLAAQPTRSGWGTSSAPIPPKTAQQPRVNVSVYYQTSVNDANFEADVAQLMLSIAPQARRWDESVIMTSPAVLFGFVRNLNAVDINDERAADRWAQTGRSVIVLCFGPNSRGQTDNFLRPATFTGRPEEMPELKRSLPLRSNPTFLKCLLCSRADYAKGVTTMTWDKSAAGDPSSGLLSYDQMVATMNKLISEAAMLQ